MPPEPSGTPATAEETAAMRRALELASRARGRTFPNPLVGAVLLGPDGHIAGEGYHRCCGEPHAEVEALAEAGERARGGTLIVTLEPCCHHGRTGPCTRSILEAGVSRVVVAMRDPDPRVDGRGCEELRTGGLDVVEGVLTREASDLNEVYVHYAGTGRSFVHLKMASSLDGRSAAADGSSRWITGQEARAAVHAMRAGASAVLVGAGTAIRDDPELTVRFGSGSGTPPVRLIAAGARPLPGSLRAFSDAAPSVLACAGPCSSRDLPDRVKIWEIGEDGSARGSRVDLDALLRRTAAEGLGRVLCEGGATLAASLMREKLVARVTWFVAPLFLGAEGQPSLGQLGIEGLDGTIRLEDVSSTRFGSGDLMMEGRVCSRG
ncbi:bifunctional diaminohydroxyphosphoribosylaminopyrimidine deaminase/5-amino-6-(5-phosphoribosylamino)uracil reductase RibD [Candidatus Fermentibacterales bacterium]|nr:bifunctional diaminohydroxyphosphoribosylaminopyrimidine deaminase/5-amino-6-(5-phosphoribosylamino)uracil reductase RibD [Candidatus Fermentibacterales bacterium]